VREGRSLSRETAEQKGCDAVGANKKSENAISGDAKIHCGPAGRCAEHTEMDWDGKRNLVEGPNRRLGVWWLIRPNKLVEN